MFKLKQDIDLPEPTRKLLSRLERTNSNIGMLMITTRYCIVEILTLRRPSSRVEERL